MVNDKWMKLFIELDKEYHRTVIQGISCSLGTL